MQKPNTVKGTSDLLGQEALDQENIRNIFSGICNFFNYENISTPILEHLETFTKTLGLSSDIISKEIYNFVDQGGDHLVLRPEGTAAVARAIITNSIQDKSNQKYFYSGPMFRRERPQSGRLRQFHQVGVEVFDNRDFHNDIQTIIIAEKFLEVLCIKKKVKLEVNTLGNLESRKKYLNVLVDFFQKEKNSLSYESQKKIDINPLRILDSKHSEDRELIKKAPKLYDFLDEESKLFFNNFIDGLKIMKIDFVVNNYLVRGLDYYNHTTFEYVTFEDKSQNAILAGGRYDGLLKSLGGNDFSGVGWAAGVERILLCMEKLESKKKLISCFSSSERLNLDLLNIICKLQIDGEYSLNFISSGSIKKKISKADKLGSIGCIILGEEEWKEENIIWKNMQTGKQEIFSKSNIEGFLKKKLKL
ncbi:MAG: histidine--tRNA ligase [Rickettsiales bacterium]|nr:histidine--tRNA ligase [Rickettsiales bacterium]